MSVRIEEEPAVEEDAQEQVLEEEEEQGQEVENTDEDPVDPEESQDDEEEEDRVVLIGDAEPAPERAEDSEETPGWVKKVRKVNRKLESENRKLKKQLLERSTEGVKKPAITLGEKPTLKGSGYDDKKFETELQEWYDRKRQIDDQQAEAKKAEAAQNQKYIDRQNLYLTKKDAHGFRDFDIAEDMVTGTLDTIQQSVIIHGAEDSALMVYALGKNPKKLEELSRVKDPVEFAIQVGKLEATLKVKSKKAPNPEKRVEGAKIGGLGGAGDKTLDRLREKAAKTGDYTEVTAYKRKLREQRSK